MIRRCFSQAHRLYRQKGKIMWLIMAVLSAVFAGVTSILAKCGIRKTDSDTATALRTLVVLLFSWVMVLIVVLQKQYPISM